MTNTDEDWGFLVASVIRHECPRCDKKYERFGTCTRTCAIELKLVQPGQKCTRDYWEGDQERTVSTIDGGRVVIDSPKHGRPKCPTGEDLGYEGDDDV